jgi:ABC-2 type transport system ATP-binding protein
VPIEIENLRKTYRVPIKQPGLLGSVRSLWDRKHREVKAVDGVNLRIERGERVGFLGPNGAGKTTTLKVLTGLLYPTEGTVRVGGYVPQARDPDYLRLITLVMGQKQQLLWDLPPLETFSLNRALFDLPRAAWRETLDELVEMLDIAEIVDQPTRNLSLGQRMRCELAAAMLHRPKILFLDEPTIGLDVQVQAQVRRFIAAYNTRHEATVMLTSHDMDDVAHLADRIVLIDKGHVRYDGSLDAFTRRYGTGRRLVVKGAGDALNGLPFTADRNTLVATVAPEEINALLAEVLRRVPTADVTVEDPPLEDVLTRVFDGHDDERGP